MSRLSADDLSSRYEALRTGALGGEPTESPRGMALLVSEGLPSWIKAWNIPVAANIPAHAGARPSAGGLGAEVVRLLTEMALGQRPATIGAP